MIFTSLKIFLKALKGSKIQRVHVFEDKYIPENVILIYCSPKTANKIGDLNGE